jgi:hypothetical protein
MIKINDTSKLGRGTLDDHDTLADSELKHVSGGSYFGPRIEWTYTRQKADG